MVCLHLASDMLWRKRPRGTFEFGIGAGDCRFQSCKCCTAHTVTLAKIFHASKALELLDFEPCDLYLRTPAFAAHTPQTRPTAFGQGLPKRRRSQMRKLLAYRAMLCGARKRTYPSQGSQQLGRGAAGLHQLRLIGPNTQRNDLNACLTSVHSKVGMHCPSGVDGL